MREGAARVDLAGAVRAVTSPPPPPLPGCSRSKAANAVPWQQAWEGRKATRLQRREVRQQSKAKLQIRAGTKAGSSVRTVEAAQPRRPTHSLARAADQAGGGAMMVR